jgi:N-acetylneuraminate synthase/N,N'-diacetyllegionaminate synthase
VKIANIDLDKEILIVAEVGNNHEGSYTLAEELISLAAQAGAGAVKFQTIVPEKLVSPSDKDRVQQLKRFQLSYEQFEKLKKTADREKIIFLSTPFDIESVLFLKEIVPAYKISSGDNNFLPLIEVVARTGKPIILSAGLTDLDEIRRTKDYIYSIWNEMGIPSHDLAILHCVVSYPTSLEDANLLSIRAIAGLGVTVGYSDHTIGIEAAVLSVPLGARIIEKHFTIDKAYSSFRDHQLSADPRELAELVRRVRGAEKMLGGAEKKVVDAEKDALTKVRRSIVVKRDMKEGQKITMEDIVWVRPGTGLSPGTEKDILGKSLKRSLKEGEMISFEDLD